MADNVGTMDFSPDRMRGHRHGQRLTMAQLASMTTLPADALAAFEYGSVKPTQLDVQQIAAALDVSLQDLARYRTDPGADYCHAVLSYARALTPDEVETAAATIRKLRGARP